MAAMTSKADARSFEHGPMPEPTLRLLPDPDATLRVVPLAPITLRMLPLEETEVPLDPPSWIAESRRRYRLRVTDWLTQSWALTRSPHRFMDAWATGKREALNPMRFAAVGLGIAVLTDRAGQRLLHVPPTGRDGVVAWLLSSSVGLTLQVVLAGLLLHVALRLKSKQPLRSSLAAVFYVFGGPAVWLGLLGWLVTGATHLVRPNVSLSFEGEPLPNIVLAYVSYAWLIAALAGAHRVRWWWAALSIFLTGFVIMMVIAVGAIIAMARGYLPVPA